MPSPALTRIVCISLTAAVPLLPAQSPDPRAILREANAAADAAREVRFVSSFFGIDGFANTAWRAKAVVTLQETDGQSTQRCRAQILLPGSKLIAETVSELICDGKELLWLEHATGTGIRGPVSDRAMGGRFGWFDPIGFTHLLTHAQPFAETAERPEIQYLGVKEVGGVACDVVHVVYDKSTGQARRWYFARSDRLPRRCEEYSRRGEVEGATVMEITALSTAPVLGDREFELAVPPGFTVRRRGELPAITFSDLSPWDPIAFDCSEPDQAYLRRLHAECGLDDVVKGCADDVERVRKVCAFSHGLWQHTSDGRPKNADPLSIVQEARAGARFRCVEYATVLVGCLQALGLPARTLNLMPREIEISFGGAGHLVVEAFVGGRWLFADPQFNAVATIAGRPANAVELQAALRAGTDVDFGPALSGSRVDYLSYVGERLFYFRTPLDPRMDGGAHGKAQVMLVPIDAPEPRVFERTFAITDCTYTRSLPAFYAQPGMVR